MTLLERELQLETLAEYAADAARNEGRLCLVSGEAGVGKSALAEALEERTPEAVWAWGACDGLFTPRPLGPLLDIAATLGGELHDTITQGLPRERIFQSLLADLGRTSLYAVLVVEDAHWADEATLDLLRFVGRRLRRSPALLLVTYRDDEVPPGHPLRRCLAQLATERSTRRVDVPRLTSVAVAELAQGSGLPADLLHHLSGGNPYFLTELLRSPDSENLPTSARDAVLGRLETLTPASRRTLEAAAAVGPRVDLPLLGELLDVVPESLDELIDAGLLVSDGLDLRFRHEITRLAVEETVPPHRSAPVHARILQLLEERGSEDAARLAHHAEGAADPAAVLRHAVLAGERASTLASHREAALQYERALRWSAAAPPETRAGLHDRLAAEYAMIDRWEDALVEHLAALDDWRSVGDRTREADTLRLLSRCYGRLCRGEESWEATRASLETLRPLGPSAELARSIANTAAIRMSRGEDDEAISAATEALALAERLGLPDVVSDALNTRGAALLNAGRSWRPDLERALALALEAGAVNAAGRAYANLQAGAATELNPGQAKRWYREGIDYCDGNDLATYANCLAGMHSGTLELAGRWEEAIALGEARLGLPNLSPVNRLCTYLSLGQIRARRGEPAEAWPHLDTALGHVTTLAEAQYIVPLRLGRTEARWVGGDPEAARTELEAALGLVHLVDPWQRGRAAAWCDRLGLERPRGELGEPFATQLRGDVEAAVAAWDQRGCPYEAALALADSTGEAHRREAVARLDDLGATGTAALVRQRLREAGARVPNGARAATRAHPRGLTRREQEVLEHLATGLTNDEIAARLFISAKTVDHHVSAVLAKMGVGTRGAAAAEASRLGLLAAAAPESGELAPTT